MASNAQKTPLARTMEQFVNRKVRAAIELTGQSLPASVVSIVGSIVVVKFELTNVPFTLPQIKVPMVGSEYVRLPIQVGCKGWVMTADAYLGGMSGLGGGTADLTPRPNLANLIWSPIANSGWTAPINPNALELYGPEGVILHDGDKHVIEILTTTSWKVEIPASSISLECTSAGWVFNGPVRFNQPVTMEQTLSVVGAISAASAAITGAITAASATLSGALTAASAGLSGALTALTAAITQTITAGGNISSTGGDVVASANLRGADMVITGQVPYTLHEHTYKAPVSSIGDQLTGTPT